MKFYTSVQQSGNSILVRGVEHGKRFTDKVKFNPTLYVDGDYGSFDAKTLEGKPVRAIPMGSIRDAKDFVEKYKELEEFPVYGQTRYINQYILDQYPQDYIDYDMKDIRVFNIDIETAAENGFPDIASADQEILAISVKDSSSGKIIVFGAKPFDNDDPMVTYMHFDTEIGLLKAFMHWWSSDYPDIITGWNVQLFDMPYIIHRIERIIGERDARLLSPWKAILRREIYIKGKKEIAYDISGIATLDYLELYRKFTYTNQASYRLDYICEVELGANKLDHSEYDTFKEFYTNDWQKFIEYNIHDVRLVDQLDDKMKLLELAVSMAYDAKVNFEDVYSQVRMWDNIIYVYLHKKGIVIPPKKESAIKNEKYAGAYVKDPVPGLYDWVVNFDLNSLYPHLIMQYNISPETLLPHKHPSANVDRLLDQEIDTSDLCGQTLCANGTFYDTNKRGFLPELMEKIYDERTIYKKKMLEAKQQYEKTPTVALKKEIARCNNIQMARKIQLNSAYGAIGNEHFRYYRLDIAEAITMGGQLSIQWVANDINGYLNKILQTEDIDYVIAADTDSIYLNLGPLVNKFYGGLLDDKVKIVNILDEIAQAKLEPFIESSYQKLADYVSAYDQKMKMKRENIAERGFWKAKKRYVLNVWDSEGVRYNKPKMKICGMDTQRSSTPQFFRGKLKDAFDIILTKDNDAIFSFISEVKKQTREQDYTDIAFPRGCNGLTKYGDRRTIYTRDHSAVPIQVRAALLYNHYIKQNELDHKYQLIQEGEKIKFIYLKTPNPIKENVIGFFQEIPKELNLDQYVDYKIQFEKSFLEPLRKVLDAIGWQTERKTSLLSFY